MSRLWPDELGAYVAPTRLCLARLRGGFRRALIREQELPIVGGAHGDWSAPLAALEARLAETDWSGTRLSVVVADHWVRYSALPYAAELRGAQECEAHARALLASCYGDAISTWSVSVSEAPPGATRLVCAMPAALLSGLRELCTRTGTRLASVQPQLTAAYNSWRHRIAESGAWFVTIERGSLAAGCIGAHGFERVHTVRIGNDWARELKRLQIFGRLANASAPNTRVYVDAPLALRAAAPAAGPDLEWLEEADTSLTAMHRLDYLRRLAA